MLSLERVDPGSAPAVDLYPDCTVFQTDEWLDFLEETQDAQRVVALVRDGNTVVGRFTGLVVKKMGMRILGSPLPGWTTAYMGFNLEPGVSRGEALAALNSFAFKEIGCVHYEVMDRNISVEDADTLGLRYRLFRGFEIDLTRPEDELFGAMQRTIRKQIRRAERSGVIIEEAQDASFADEYYAQLVEVFRRQGLRPTYGVDRVAALMRHLLPTGRLVLFRAREPEGYCAATKLTLGFEGKTYSWGGSSQRNLDVPHRNEAMTWHVVRYWKERGMAVLDMGGGGEYKGRYGGCEIGVPWIRRSKYAGFEFIRESARRSFAFQQRLIGGLSRRATKTGA